MDYTLPHDLLHQIFENVEDKETIDRALEHIPDIVHSAVRRIHSPIVVEEPITYLTAFKRLERATNILVRVSYRDLDTLRPLSRLHGLCIEVYDVDDSEICIRRLVQLFRMQEKKRDQLWVIKTGRGDFTDTVCIRDSHWLSFDNGWKPVGFSYTNIFWLHPRPYFDFLLEASGLVDYKLRQVLDIVLKYKAFNGYMENDILVKLEDAIGEDDFADMVETYLGDFIADAGVRHGGPLVNVVADSLGKVVDMPWHLLHYYDIPSIPIRMTKEEEDIISRGLLYDTDDEDRASGTEGPGTEGPDDEVSVATTA